MHDAPPISALSTFLSTCGGQLDLSSFPTRRSSDLGLAIAVVFMGVSVVLGSLKGDNFKRFFYAYVTGWSWIVGISLGMLWIRSEEHTSELQSQSKLVCRLLPEKKIQKIVSTHL